MPTALQIVGWLNTLFQIALPCAWTPFTRAILRERQALNYSIPKVLEGHPNEFTSPNAKDIKGKKIRVGYKFFRGI